MTSEQIAEVIAAEIERQGREFIGLYVDLGGMDEDGFLEIDGPVNIVAIAEAILREKGADDKE